MHTKFWSEKLNDRGPLVHLDVDGNIILKLILSRAECVD